MSENNVHAMCDKVIGDLEAKLKKYRDFLEVLLEERGRMLPDREKYQRVIHDIIKFLQENPQ